MGKLKSIAEAYKDKSGKVVINIEHSDIFLARVGEEILYKTKDKTPIWIEIKRRTEEKTLPQLGYWYAVCLPLLHRGFKDAGWVLSQDSVDSYIKKELGFVEDIVNGVTGEVVDSVAMSKADFDEDMMGKLIDHAIKFGIDMLDISIPPPNKDWWRNRLNKKVQ